MSSASDKTVFEESVEGQDNVNLFESKKWTYITDSTSSNGQFSGQIQFDLNTLSSQNQWTDLSQAVITFPVKLSIKNNNSVAPLSTSVTAATIKNGFHQFVDSVQIVLGGTTVQSSQIFTNIDATYKILTEWSQDTLEKYGSTFGVALDDINTLTDTNTGLADTVDNLALTTAPGGFDILTSQGRNPGVKERFSMFNNDTQSTNLGKSILGNNQSVLGKSNVSYGTSATAGQDVFVLYALGKIRLKDISDCVGKLPLMKGMKGFIYINYNSSSSVISNTGASSTVTSVNNSAVFGRCTPALYNIGVGAAEGIQLSNAATAPVTFTADINATASNLTAAVPIQTNAVLYAPYYIATPEVDRALTFRKSLRYNERFVTQFSINANGNYTATLSPGISNPSTTSPFAALKDLQLYVANQPMFQQPVTMDWHTFNNEVAQNGLDGGLVDQASSGLLSERLWNTLYRYYTCDVGRRMNSEDGASKSIQISCSNATNCPMTVIAIIQYEREITVDSASGMVSQSM